MATGSRAAGQVLTSQELAQPIALGERCVAPIIRLTANGADFEAYVESPFARAALAGATARLMHQPLESSFVNRAVRPGYRIRFGRLPEAPLPAAVTHVRVRSSGREAAPIAELNERFFVGTVPSHGIVEPLRARFPEYVFEQLPAGDFVLVVGTTHGTYRFTVTARERASVMRVCN